MDFYEEIILNLKSVLFTGLIFIAIAACSGGGGGGGGAVNTAPVANDDSAITSENNAININVIANDTDNGGIDPTSVMIVTDVTNGMTQVNADGTVDYTPNGGFNGPDTFTYNVLDNQGLISNEATASITVTDVFLLDDFGDGNFNGWTIVDDVPAGTNPNWSVIANVLRQQTKIESTQSFVQSYHTGTYAHLSGAPGPSLINYRFSVDASFLGAGLIGSGRETDLGIMFRYVDNNNYYRLSLDSLHGFTRLEKRVGGIFTPLASNSRGYLRNQTITFTVEVNGSNILIFQDGDPLFAIIDADLPTGSVALYTQGDSSFDNVLIEEVSLLPQVVLSTPIAHSVVTGNTLNATSIASNVPAGGSVQFLLDGGNAMVDTTAPYSAQFTGVAQGNHTVTAILRNSANSEVARDDNVLVGTLGNLIVGLGDSILRGALDNYETDNLSADPRIVGYSGYPANISQQLNASLTPQPNLVVNEGIGGDRASSVLNLRLNSIIARNAGANQAYIQLGTNDALTNVPDGLGCTFGVNCGGTFKGNMQSIINALTGAGITSITSLIPPVWGTSSSNLFVNPLSPVEAAVNTRVQNYNNVVTNELVGDQIGPDLFTFFLQDNNADGDADDSGDINRISLFSDHLHLNGLGYFVIGILAHNAINPGNPVALPFILDDLTPSTVAPYLKQNLLEVADEADEYYVDQNYTLASIPPALTTNCTNSLVTMSNTCGRWVMTSSADSGSTEPNNYLSFQVDRGVTVYVAYDDDANAANRPAWLGALGFVDSGLNVDVTGDPGADSFDLFSRSYNANDTVMLGGNSAPPATGHSQYFVIVVAN